MYRSIRESRNRKPSSITGPIVTCALGKSDLDGLREKVSGGMSDDVQAFLVSAGDDLYVGVMFYDKGTVHKLAVNLAGEGRLGQAGTDIGRDLLNGDWMMILALASVGKRYVRHECTPVVTDTRGHMTRPQVAAMQGKLVGAIGLEPTTPTMSRWCSNQLSYAPVSAPQNLP